MVEQHLSGDVHLTLRPKDADNVASSLLIREPHMRVGLRLNVMNEDALLPQQSAVVPPRNRHGLDDEIFVLGRDEFHHALLEVVEVHRVFRRRPRNDVVLVVVVPSERSEFLRVGELDVDSVLLHDPLDVLPADADDALVIRLRNVERDFGREFFLKHRETVEGARVVSGDVDEEVVVVEGFKLDLDVGGFHDLVELAVLLARDELAVFVGELDLEADLVVEGLRILPRSVRFFVTSLRKKENTHLDKVELQHQLHRLPNLRLQPMKLEAVTLEDGFGAGSNADVAKDGRDLSGVDRGRGHEDVEGDGEEPEGGDVELAGLKVRVRLVSFRSMEGKKEGRRGRTHQSHNRSNSPLDVDAVVTVNRDQTRLTPDGREVDESSVVVHDLLEVFEAIREHPVELAREDGRVAGDDALALRAEDR